MLPLPAQAPEGVRGRLASMKVSGAARGFFKKLSVFSRHPESEDELKDDNDAASFEQHENHSATSLQSHASGRNALTREKIFSALRKVKQESTHPSGVLAIHLKRLILENLDMYKLFQRYHATVYMKVSGQNQVKCTAAYPNVSVPSTVLMDEIKHFRLTVSNKRTDPSNYIRIELMALCSDNDKIHKIISTKDIHLYDVIKNQFSVEPIQMRSVDKHIDIGELELEFCFAYGTFGYGYSSQFDNRQKKPQEQLAHAMFCRVEPPDGREDFVSDVMTCRQVGHPCFIDFPKKAHIGETSSVFGPELQLHPELQIVEEPYLLISKMKKRMHQMESEYG